MVIRKVSEPAEKVRQKLIEFGQTEQQIDEALAKLQKNPTLKVNEDLAYNILAGKFDEK